MLNVAHVCERLNINARSNITAIQDVRQLIEGATNPIAAARSIISNFVADGTDVELKDEIEARMIAQHLVNNAILLGDKYDPLQTLKQAAERITRQRIENPWFFYKKTFSTVETVTETRHDVAVEVKADGKIKKGGKQVLAQALYEKHKGKDNKAIIEIFMRELDMSKPGATTYFYNAKKAASK